MAKRRGVGLLLAALALPLGAAAQDAQRGKLLYETHCGDCHYERVHERQRSDLKDIADLRDTVWRRSRETKRRSFSLDELEDITQYLNASHYHFASERPKKP